MFSGEARIEDGARVDGDVFIASGDLNARGDIDGDIVMTSGNLWVNGEVDGDIFATAGSVDLGRQAHVRGDVANLGGRITKAPGARIDGAESEGAFKVPAVPVVRLGVPSWSPWGWLVGTLIRALIMAVLAVLIVSVWPAQVDRAALAATAEPLVVGLVGLVTFIILIPVIIALIITVCFSPLGLLGLLVLGLATLLGWTALGTEVGRRMGPALYRELTPVAAAGIGTGLLTVVAAIPCIGWLICFVVSCLALGSAIMTRFGARDYPGTVVPVTEE